MERLIRLTMTNSLALSQKDMRNNQSAILAFLFALMLSFMGLTSSGQTAPIAELTPEGVIVLPVDVPVASAYSFDASQLSFETDKELFQFFDALNNDLFLIRVNPESRKGQFMPRSKGRNGWSIEEWNNAIREQCEQRPIRTEN